MRSFAFIALGSFIASFSLTGQSLSEHAAAAAGATVGTAAGKPLGTALGKIFGSMDQSTSKAAGTKVTKPVATKTEVKPEVTAGAPTLAPAPSAPLVAGGSGSSGSSGGGSVATGHSARRRELPAEEPLAPIAPVAPVIPEPVVVKEPSVDQIAAIQVGVTANELQSALGAPESRVSIPGDDGHLLEICQYWAKGQPLGTVRLDNGRVVSVQTRGY
jgi:hypothetical protein